MSGHEGEGGPDLFNPKIDKEEEANRLLATLLDVLMCGGLINLLQSFLGTEPQTQGAHH